MSLCEFSLLLNMIHQIQSPKLNKPNGLGAFIVYFLQWQMKDSLDERPYIHWVSGTGVDAIWLPLYVIIIPSALAGVICGMMLYLPTISVNKMIHLLPLLIF